MIKLTYGTNLERHEELIDGTRTPKDLWEDFGFPLDVGVLALDGCPLSASEMNTPLAQLVNNADHASLIQVIKTSNG